MPLPANVTTVTVLGTFLTPEGEPSVGTVSFTPSSWLLNSGANIAIPNSAVVKTLGTAGDFSAVLPITDDPDLSPGGWVYSVSEVVDGVSQSYNIAIPGTVAAGGTVFLADLAPVAPAGPEYYSLASSLAIGTVTTVPTGGSATATITGLAPSQVLNLGIPVGATGTVASAGSGSVGTAAVAPQGDPDTGIYFPAANQVAITTGGSAAATFAAGAISNPTFTGVASFPDGSAAAPAITNTGDTNTGLAFPDADTVIVSTGGTERLRVASNGRVGIGINTPLSPLDVTQGIGATRYAGRAFVSLARAAGSASSPTAVGSSDQLSYVAAYGHDGTSFVETAGIAAYVSGTVSTSVVPSELRFLTTTAAGTLTERMKIDSNGLITGTGTSLGAWTAYTPTLGGTGWAIGDGTWLGTYCQIGKMVHFRMRLSFGATTTVGSTHPTITLPVTAASSTRQGIHANAYDTSAAALYQLVGHISTSSTVLLRTVASPLGTISATAPFTWATGDEITISGTYEAA